METRFARWVLALSLAVNLFFVVVALWHPPFLRPKPPDPHHIIDRMKEHLSIADGQILQETFDQRSAAIAEVNRASHEFPDRIRAALMATPFDPDALRNALATGRALHLSVEDAMSAAFVEAATRMSPDGRAKLAASPGFGPPPGPGMGLDHGPPPPPH